MSGRISDVLIIGGGPAGCSAAITLAGANVQALVCEAGTYPHSKVCGEFLSPECTELLAALGLESLLASRGGHPIESVQLTGANGASWKTKLPGSAWGLSRSALDAGLAQHASQQGAGLRPAAAVVGIRGGLEQGFEVDVRTSRGRTEVVRARAVIAAYGKRSALDRAWGREFFHHDPSFVALKSHFYGPPLDNCVALHAFPGGYCGLSEIERGLSNVSLLVHERTFRAALGRRTAGLKDFVSWMRRQNAYLDDWLSRAAQAEEGWLSIGRVSFGARQVVVGDVLMAGDSAGLMAPLAGDGIAMALQSGMMAANRCLEFLDGKLSAQQMRQRYQAAWRREFGGRLKLARVLQAFMLRPALFAGALGLLTAVPQFGQQLILNTRSARRPEAAL
jgi:menaquinone-9 beta-reductase